jgi:hypothetical protein
MLERRKLARRMVSTERSQLRAGISMNFQLKIETLTQ